MLPSSPNALSTTAEDVYYLQFFSEIRWYLASDVVSELFQSVFLQTDHVPSRPELPLSFTVAVVTTLWPFVQTFTETIVTWASSLRDLIGEVSSLEWIASNFSSVSTGRFLSGLLYSSDPVVFSLLTRFVYLEMVVLETRTENFCDIFQ